MNNSVKITSGKLRGRSIRTPSGKTHPMGKRERLALFNMINEILSDAKVLDAFAGSGALGIEAISRGATEVVFVEKDARAVNLIRQNLANLNIDARVVLSDVINFVDKANFDLILADPPYDDFKIEPIIRLVKLLRPGGTLVLSHPDEALEISGLKLLKTRTYAAAHISIYVK